MNLFRMLFLPGRSSSVARLWLCLLLLSACASAEKRISPAALPLPYIAQASGGVVYDATFRYKDFQASGLLVMKQLQEGEYHVVLLSKMGPSLMEFKLNREGIQWIKTFEQLRKKSAEELLERDFRVLLLSTLETHHHVHPQTKRGRLKQYKIDGKPGLKILVEPETNRVMYAENRGFLNPVKTKVHFRYGEGSIPREIQLLHRNLRMSMELRLLQ